MYAYWSRIGDYTKSFFLMPNEKKGFVMGAPDRLAGWETRCYDNIIKTRSCVVP